MTGGEMTETGYTLRELVERVHEARTTAAIAWEGWDSTLRAFEALHAPEIAAMRDSRADVADREYELRTAAVNWYILTGQTNKAPMPGVGIRVTTRLVYDRHDALQWAQDHHLALTLDVKAFEGIAKHGAVDGIVTFQVEPQATISSDLGKALEG